MAHPIHEHTGRALEQVGRVRRICLSFPETTEKTAWGAPTFRVKGKMFGMFYGNHHGDGRIALWLPAPEGAQAILVAADPERIFVPPYQGPHGWIGLLVELFDDEEITAHVSEAYCMIAPKKLRALLESRGNRKE
jgi:hypothetical protein